MNLKKFKKHITFFLLLEISLIGIAQKNEPKLLGGNFNPKLCGIYSSSLNLYAQTLNEESYLPSDFPLADEQFNEQIEKRTFTSRTFTSNTGKVVIKYGSRNLNFLSGVNKLEPISTKLSSAINGWEASKQDFPTYLNFDGSTCVSSKKNKFKFNSNCRVNGTLLNCSNYTVGEDGMFVKDVIAGVDKKIIFSENRIETDYILNEQVTFGNQDLIISEEIDLPAGYYFSTNKLGEKDELIIYSEKNIEQVRFSTPFFYDSNKNRIFGKYNLVVSGGKNILDIVVPSSWLNASDRAYPIIIDPVVTGPVSNYPAIYMNSCVLPSYARDSILVTIPANITITAFIVEDSYFADVFAGAWYSQGALHFITPCGIAGDYSVASPQGDSSGYCYLLPGTDLKSLLACCFVPSCNIQTFYLAHYLGRTNWYGPGCNQNSIYYSPVSPWPFSAYMVGHSIETTQNQWSIFPTTVCSDSCTVYLKVLTNYGVPPYTISHPWATGNDNYGAWGSCLSVGKDTIALTIPGCPYVCGNTQVIAVPSPTIIDVCGNAVTGLTTKNITIKPVPDVIATDDTVCVGNLVTIAVSSCVPTATYSWTGSNGSSGIGNIVDTATNFGATSISVTYTVLVTASGCFGAAQTVSAEIAPLPVVFAGSDTIIIAGSSVQLNAQGASTYTWNPSFTLNCATCVNPIALPILSTIYTVTGANQYGCINSDDVSVTVIPSDEVLYIPNAFTPNGNGLNETFNIYGTGIKSIDLQIFDRWGELLFHSTDLNIGWDGKYKDKQVADGVYVYKVDCEFISNEIAYRVGKVVKLTAKQ